MASSQVLLNKIYTLMQNRGTEITEADVVWITGLLDTLGRYQTKDAIDNQIGMLAEGIIEITGNPNWKGKNNWDWYYAGKKF